MQEDSRCNTFLLLLLLSLDLALAVAAVAAADLLRSAHDDAANDVVVVK